MGSERWDRERDHVYERDRFEDDRFYMKGGRGRERSEDRFDRPRYYEDDYIRDRRVYEDEPRYEPRREPARQPEIDRRVVVDKEREREYYLDPSPRRPAFLKRQSSLDTFDRRPSRHIFNQREEYPPPARREDIYRDDYYPQAHVAAPLPRVRGLPPPGRREDRYYDDYRPSESDYYPDDDHRFPPERMREREFIRERDRRDRSRESRATRSHTHRSSSSRSSSSGGSSKSGGTTIRSEYPKRGKTKIPVRLVSKRALIDLGYPYIEEQNTIIVQKALGQENIDELLKLSEEYNKVDHEVAAARSSAGNVVEERIEETRKEKITEVAAPAFSAPPPPPLEAAPAPPPPPPAAPSVAHAAGPGPGPGHGPGPVVVDVGPRTGERVEIVDRTVVHDSSPTRSTSSWDSGHHHRRHHHHHYEDGALVVVPRSRSRSRSQRAIRAEIKALERELVHRPRTEIEREVVRTERLPNGELIIYEEEVERTIARPKPPRIEKDRKGPSPGLVRAMLSTLT